MTERAAKNMEKGFTHFDQNGNAVMVDVSGKQVTYRTALATGYISVGPEIMEAVTAGNVKKGDVLGYNLTHLASNLNLRAEKFTGFLNFFTGNDLTNLELKFLKIVKGDL